MGTALFIGTIISFGLVIIVQAKWKQEKAELTQTIDYLNRNLTEENVETFAVTRSFDFKKTLNSATPKVIYDNRNMKNPFYRTAIKNYESGKRNASIMTTIFVVMFLIIVTVLMVYYPEVVKEALENGKSQ